MAVYPDDGTDAASLVQSATLALQAPTPDDDDPITFHSPEMNAAAQARRAMEHELRGAASRGELELQYQPVVDLRQRRLLGAEALLRWHSPTLGEVPPSTFVPIAEQTGLIMGLGEWALDGAIRQAREWREGGMPPIRVNVNISVREFRSPGFAERVAEIFSENGLDPASHGLGIEITETELMEEISVAAEAIGRFKAMGLWVYIDDFGTGYSSLSYLRSLPVDAVKIDRSFVADMAHDASAAAVVRGIVALAHSLGLQVIAEGVETEEQVRLLTEYGCDAGQGFLFSQAGSPQAIVKMAERRL